MSQVNAESRLESAAVDGKEPLSEVRRQLTEDGHSNRVIDLAFRMYNAWEHGDSVSAPEALEEHGMSSSMRQTLAETYREAVRYIEINKIRSLSSLSQAELETSKNRGCGAPQGYVPPIAAGLALPRDVEKTALDYLSEDFYLGTSCRTAAAGIFLTAPEEYRPTTEELASQVNTTSEGLKTKIVQLYNNTDNADSFVKTSPFEEFNV